jgi:hypothetical protein
MKKLILSITLMAFAIAAQAGEAKTASKEKSACCSDKAVTKVKATSDAKTCSATQAAAAKNSCPIAAAAAASKCSAGGATACKDAPAKQAVLSPKAAAETKKL